MTEELHALQTDDGTKRGPVEIFVIWGVALLTVGILIHQLVMPTNDDSVSVDVAISHGPAHVTRFDVMYAHRDYTRFETFEGTPADCIVVGNSGTEVLVAGKLSEPLAAANLVLADGTVVTADTQALGNPKNPIARFRFEIQDDHQGEWRYRLTNLSGEETCSEPLILIVLPEKPSKTWPSWPDDPSPKDPPVVTVT